MLQLHSSSPVQPQVLGCGANGMRDAWPLSSSPLILPACRATHRTAWRSLLHRSRLLPAPAGAAAAATSDACAPTFNWFPTATEIGEDIVINNKTCTGKQVCNFPKVWAKGNQTQYMPQLGSSLKNGLLKVAFKQFGNQPPRLFFTPVSEFLEAGADVSACASHAPASRHLLATAKVGLLFGAAPRPLWQMANGVKRAGRSLLGRGYRRILGSPDGKGGCLCRDDGNEDGGSSSSSTEPSGPGKWHDIMLIPPPDALQCMCTGRAPRHLVVYCQV